MEELATMADSPWISRNLGAAAGQIGSWAAKYKPGKWKSEALKITRDLQGVWTTETRLTDADFQRILDASGLMNANSVESFGSSINTLDGLVARVATQMAKDERNALAGMELPTWSSILDEWGIPKTVTEEGSASVPEGGLTPSETYLTPPSEQKEYNWADMGVPDPASFR